MKNKIFGILVCMMLLCSFGASAITMPHPVYGVITYNGEGLGGIQIKYENSNTGKDFITTTTENGFYQFELANVDSSYRDNDAIKITVQFCSDNPTCSKSDIISGGGNQLSFDVSGLEGVTYICWNGDIVSNLADCPEQEPSPSETIPETDVDSAEGDKIAVIEAYFYQPIDVILSHSKLIDLIDTEIEFDDEDYDVKEEIRFKGIIQTSLSDEDFETNPYLVIYEGDIDYRYVFVDEIPISDISEDEPLEITLLGEPVEIIKATADSITLISGERFVDVAEGATVKGVTVTSIETGYCRVSYSGSSETIDEGETASLGDLEVYVEEATGDDDVGDVCTLRIGEDVKRDIDDGDDYSDEELFTWNINLPNYIGISNQVDYEELDEETKPLTVGDKILLPNGMKIKFQKVTNLEITELKIEVDEGYLRITGDNEAFTLGGDEFDEILIDGDGIYDEDEILISTDKVRIDESDFYVELVDSIVRIEKLEIELDMSEIYYDGVSFRGKDDDYVTENGIIFKDPEEAIIDQSGFVVIIPEERPEATVTIGDELSDERPEDCPDCPVCKDGTCPTTDCPAEKSCPIAPTCPAEKICPEEKVCDECPVVPVEGNPGAWIITIIATALASGGAGVYFTKNKALGKNGAIKIYRNRNGEEVIQHKHPGILGYHEPNTQHRDTIERHPRGQLYPHYEKNASGVWAYIK